MNKDQILQAEGEELSRLLGEVLQPKKTEHIFEMQASGSVQCKKCYVVAHYWQGKYIADDKTTSCIPDPIPLDDFNIAMAWRDWAVAEYGSGTFAAMMEFVWAEEHAPNWHEVNRRNWAMVYAKPKHYLQAAALCKLNAEQSNE